MSCVTYGTPMLPSPTVNAGWAASVDHAVVVSPVKCAVIQVSGVMPGALAELLSQHQSSHQPRTPCCSNESCRSKYACSCPGSLQSNTRQVSGAYMHSPRASSPPAVSCAWGTFGPTAPFSG